MKAYMGILFPHTSHGVGYQSQHPCFTAADVNITAHIVQGLPKFRLHFGYQLQDFFRPLAKARASFRKGELATPSQKERCSQFFLQRGQLA